MVLPKHAEGKGDRRTKSEKNKNRTLTVLEGGRMAGKGIEGIRLKNKYGVIQIDT